MPLLLLIAFLALAAYGAYAVWQRVTLCEPDVRAEIVAPDGAKRAVVFRMECVPSDGQNTQIALSPAQGGFDPGRSPTFFVMNGHHDIGLSWPDAYTLHVTLPRTDDRIVVREDDAGIVAIHYEEARP